MGKHVCVRCCTLNIDYSPRVIGNNWVMCVYLILCITTCIRFLGEFHCHKATGAEMHKTVIGVDAPSYAQSSLLNDYEHGLVVVET
jgi:hypothetical protein